MSRSGLPVRFVPALVAVLLAVAMAGPERSMAEHLDLDPKVEARIGDSTGTGRDTKWQIIVEWNVNCFGGDSFRWDVHLIDEATGFKYLVEGKVASPEPLGSRTLSAPPPPLGARVYPQILASCSGGEAEHSSPAKTARGQTITIPGEVPEGGDGAGGGGGGGGGGGTPDLAPGPCANTKRGTAGDDLLSGTAAGDRLLGFGGDDRLRGLRGRDCLLGGKGSDRQVGGKGGDRLSGGKGRDRLSGGRGRDVIRARDGARDRVRCGAGRDTVYVDRRDRVSRSDCERVIRRK